MNQPVTNTTLDTLVGWYEESEDATVSARALSERDRDYYDNKQLTSAEEAALKKRNQPPVIINRIKPKVDYLLGVERETRTDPRAAPRTPMDEEAAHAATDAIRYVCDSNNFQQVCSEAFENSAVEGIGGAIVEWNGKRVTITHVPWDRLFFDPHSRRRDFSDAKYVGIVMWMDVDDAVSMYPQAKDILESAISSSSHSETYDDKPLRWVDRKRKRVKVCQIFWRSNGGCQVATYTKGGFIIEPAESAYQDDEGNSICNLRMMSCYVDRENNRYGVVRQLISPQDEVNKRRSKALHLISVRQFRAERGAVDDVARAKAEAAKPDGWIETNPGFEFEMLPTSDMAAAQFQLLQESKGEIDNIGANQFLTGKNETAMSGRALQARQQGGMMELGPVFDSLRMWKKSIYEMVWYCIKQYWTGETWVRITDDENNIKFVGLNRQMVDEMTGMPVIDPNTGLPAIQNNVAAMNVDIILEDVPDTVNIQAEQFQMLVEIGKTYGPEVVPPDLIVEASSLRNKKQILKRMKGTDDPQRAQMQQEAAQIVKVKELAEIEKTKSEIDRNRAETEKTLAEISKVNAETAMVGANTGEKELNTALALAIGPQDDARAA